MIELIIAIIKFIFSIIGAILKAIFGVTDNSTTGYQGSGGNSSSEKFRIKINNETLDGDEFNWDIFHIEARGPVTGPYDNFRAKFIVQTYDITDGSEEIVLSTYEEFQKDDSEIFWFESSSMPFPYEYTMIQDWIQVVKIPKIFLSLPRKGRRKLKFKVYVVNSSNDKIITESSMTAYYNNPDNGYKDAVEHREYFEEMVIKSAMLVSASDGEMDASEAKIVNNWIQKRISRYTESSQSEHKQRLNGYVKEAYAEINNGNIDIYDVLDGIDNIASEGDKFELFQVCLDVARADGEADKKELEMVHDIADYIDLDEKQFRSMIEKTLPITIHTGKQTPENILGITSDMTNSEVKKHLMAAYRKWNQRVANSDPEIRKQAEEMIHMIADLRKKYT